jgi:nucleoporin POM34
LLQKTLNRRQSYGSPLSNSNYSANPASLSGLGGMGSPSPVSGKASVGLNSKWLYEKGRQSGGARAGLFS